MTKHKELDEERKAYQYECMRLTKILREVNVKDKLRRITNRGYSQSRNQSQA